MTYLKKLLAMACVAAGLMTLGGVVLAPPAIAHSWTELRPAGPLPPPRQYPAVAYDPAANRLIMSGGGEMPVWYAIADDLWILTNADGSEPTRPQWIRIDPDRPLMRSGHSASYSSASNRMIVFGGVSDFFGPLPEGVLILTDANGVGGDPQWQELPVAPGPKPRARFGHAAVYDGANNRLTIHGGTYLDPRGWLTLNDTWVLTNADGRDAAPSQWLKLEPTGPRPNAALLAGIVAYDAGTNQMALIARKNRASPLNTLWVLQNVNGVDPAPSQWVKKRIQGVAPERRFGSAGGYSPIANAIVLFGGTGQYETYTIHGDTWLLKDAFGTKPRWRQSSPRGNPPPPLHGAGSVFVGATDRLILTNGDLNYDCCDHTNKTYVFRSATK